MRITGGVARGQLLKLPKNFAIRPTTERVREAIFSMLASIESDWSRVLDLYAGTGALGIEALSRGADWTDFVDQEPRCCAIIKQNLDKIRLLEKTHIYCCSVSKALNFLDRAYSLVFMDPPYADKNIENIIVQLGSPKYLIDESLVVIPHTSRLVLEEKYDSLHLIKKRQHGDTCISIYRKEVDN